jgi:DNA-binding transcriptional ArsR family regulator
MPRKEARRTKKTNGRVATIGPLVSDQSVRELAQVFKILSDETRLQILFYLAQSSHAELHVAELCHRLGQSQPAVSHHLALLRVSGLIESRREGKHNIYYAQSDRFGKLVSVFNAAQGAPTAKATLSARGFDQPVRELTQFFKLLSDETRLRILFFLARSRDAELHVTDLCHRLGQSQPAVSHHLALLRVAGLIESRREGKHNFYCLRTDYFPGLLLKLLDRAEDAPPGKGRVIASEIFKGRVDHIGDGTALVTLFSADGETLVAQWPEQILGKESIGKSDLFELTMTDSGAAVVPSFRRIPREPIPDELWAEIQKIKLAYPELVASDGDGDFES